MARVLAGEAVRDSQPAALEALAITIRTFAAGEPEAARRRRVRFVRSDALSGGASGGGGHRARRAGDGAVGCCCATASRRPFTTRRRAAAAPRFRPTSGPAPRIHPSCRRARTTPAKARRRGRRASAKSDLLRALRAGGFRGDRLRDVRIASRNASGRVAQLTLEGLQPGMISGQDLRVVVGRTLGWQHIKSTVFDLRRHGDSYRFTGHGSGHGVGMCVIGSAKLAERGTTAAAILAQIFSGPRDFRPVVCGGADPRPRPHHRLRDGGAGVAAG